MTVLIAGICLVLSAAFTWFTGSMGGAVGERARAQYAADAAALAAAGAMAPGASAAPEEEAEDYATANGAKLEDCACDPSSAEAVVTVSIGDIDAQARAVLDLARIAPQWLGTTSDGLHPAMEAAVSRLLAAGRGAIVMNSGFRSSQRQTELWQDALRKYGNPEVADDWVARPGHSMHERGLAVDLGGDIELAQRLAIELGLPLYRPLANEPWHFELLGSR